MRPKRCKMYHQQQFIVTEEGVTGHSPEGIILCRGMVVGAVADIGRLRPGMLRSKSRQGRAEGW
jgi:hypothetical protein